MDNPAFDAFLASALRSPPADWPSAWDGSVAEGFFDRIAYHGIAGLIIEIGAIGHDWPDRLRERIRQQAIAQAMWENSHRASLAELFDALVARGLDAILLKGTAVAYSHYSNPSARQRGDSDLLVRFGQLDPVRQLLASLGYRRYDAGQTLPDELQLQEVWSIEAAGQTHTIDLHWSLLNALALRDLVPFDEVLSNAVPLPRLGDGARAPSRPHQLLHACLHRLMHDASPYIVDGVNYYGGNRLIWLYDIHLLAGGLDDGQWETFLSLARRSGSASICREGVEAAVAALGTKVPEEVLGRLDAPTDDGKAARYLRSGQLRRAVMDVQSLHGLGDKLRLVSGRLLPNEQFLRSKYPGMGKSPLALLHARRLAELVRERPR